MARRRQRRRFEPPRAGAEAIAKLGEAIAEHFGVPAAEVRYAEYRFHDGEQWTVWAGWERLVDGVWGAEQWLPDVHST